MKTKLVTTALALATAVLGLTGCAGIISKYVKPSDYVKLVDFNTSHDSTLQVGSSTVVFKNTSGTADIWQANFALSPAGLGKVHVNTVPYTQLPDEKGYSGYAPASFKVSVNSTSAKNLKWEVWMSGNQYQVHSAFGSTAVDFQYILGPFKIGEVIDIEYLKGKVDSYGQQYQARQPVIVVYSPSERGEKFSVDVYKPELIKP